jgi:hypothetical protein
MKSRVRDPNGLTFGTYMLVDASTGATLTGSGPANRGYGLALDEIERYLKGDRP